MKGLMSGAYILRRREGGKEAIEIHKPANLPPYNNENTTIDRVSHDVIARQLVKIMKAE